MKRSHPFLLAVMLAQVSLQAMPLIVAHRGASADAPENTLPAFNLAWEQNADAIEGDFYLTRDGHIVCIHDGDTKRVAGAGLKVADATLAELRRLDVGTWKGAQWAGTRIPTIDEVLATVPDGKRIYIEVKCGPEIVPQLIAAVGRSGLRDEQIVVISFNADVIQAIEAAAPQFKTCWLSGFKREESGELKPTSDAVMATLARSRADGFSSSHDLVEPALIKRVQAAGYEYHVWTVDDPAVARRFVDWGALSITTNKPATIREALRTSP